ncbi:two-component regulator propeller domain-containing protein [Flavivirga abyssicola]|uniref:hybrid sensor histidine kinase/response regulator transcription factor n=1 Tax=Flavivirga abyssicola TaxID=3063533 RepID=UPI0026E07FF7|nr:two-component regulator propeller domain-containing protein [Flavivirga sp. MEBiC07777]WVK11953.1 two-component regulator propeller domain-containing protein [Flavivirga sp. MEBiC07777]
MYSHLNKKLCFCLITYLFLFFSGIYDAGSQNGIYFDHITTDDGLSQSDINSIYQDDQGFMWFATHEGLNKYDGYNFTIYSPDSNNPNSINSNLIFSLAGDKDGNLWVGTTGKGVNHFDKSLEKFTHFLHEEGNGNSLVNNHISSIYVDNKNRLWVGTIDGLDLADLNRPLDSIKFEHFNLDHGRLMSVFGDNNVHSIFEDSKGQIWVGGSRGIYKLSRDQNGDTYFILINDWIGLPRIPVRDIDEDNHGRLLIGTTFGLYVLTKKGEARKAKNGHKAFINDILVEDDNIWVGTNKGLLLFDNSKSTKSPKFLNQFTYDPKNPNSISKNMVKSLEIDATGIIWAGTNGGGVNKFDPERKRFEHVKKTLNPKSLSYDKIRSIFEDSNGALWIGTEGGGLNMLPPGSNNYLEFVNFKTILNSYVTIEIERDNKKLLIMGAENTSGLHQLDITDPENIKESDIKISRPVQSSVFALLEDRYKNLWIGTYNGGVSRWLYDQSSDSYEEDFFSHDKKDSLGISSNIIRNIFEDSKGNIWFATGNGLCKLKPNQLTKKKPRFDVYKNIPSDSTSISHNYILELFESKDGNVWIGTLGGGLNKFIPSKDGSSDRFKSYKDVDGLPNNVIKGILDDDEGNLWLSTNKGLSKFDPVKEVFKNYDANDGLQNNEFQELARLKRKNGQLLFGGINGFNAFYPDEIRDNVVEAETIITDFSISNETVGIGEKINGRVILDKTISETKDIRLKYQENSFSFEFGALHYASPQKNQFAYMLEGFDKDWIYTTANKRFATYTNLRPNIYTLMVKASNNDGVWDSTPAEIKIEVIPPFWLTNYAYLFYSLVIIGFLLLFRRFTIIKTTKKHQLEIDHFEKEKAEELQRIKLEFFTNISHEFRTPITLIKGPLKYLQKNVGKLDKNVIQEQYRLIQKNSDYLLKLVNELLDFRKINQGKMRLVMRKSNITNFIREVCEPFQFLVQKKQISFSLTTSDEELEAWFDHDALEKIMSNLLSNAFKFTPEKGSIKVEIALSKDKGFINGYDEDDLSFVDIKVKDSGIGIEASKLPNIFERFYTDKDNSNPKGVGIGLSFTKDIVELHQGSIKVESQPNDGTTFIVRLPVEKKVYDDIPEISCKDASEVDFYVRTSETDSIAISINDELVDSNLSKARSKLPVLLIVDDNADIRSFIKRVLGEEYNIYEAENGKVGLELANKLMPNIIVTDIMMPIMDGIEFCEEIKTRKETSHIPVIMLTAKLSQETEIKGLKIGADGYIRKPFDVELLELKLSNILKFREELRKRFNRDISLQPQEVTVTSMDERFLKQAIEIVEKNMMNTDFNVEMLVREMGHSRSNLYLKFKEITGLSSSEFIRNIRLKRAVQLFEKSDFSVKEIMHMTGFNTASYFAKCFKKQFGVIPSEYVSQNLSNKADK